jgi:hypothetical protein
MGPRTTTLICKLRACALDLLGSIQEVELPVLLTQEVLGMERRLPLQVHAHHTVPCRGVTSVLAHDPPPPLQELTWKHPEG